MLLFPFYPFGKTFENSRTISFHFYRKLSSLNPYNIGKVQHAKPGEPKLFEERASVKTTPSKI